MICCCVCIPPTTTICCSSRCVKNLAVCSAASGGKSTTNHLFHHFSLGPACRFSVLFFHPLWLISSTQLAMRLIHSIRTKFLWNILVELIKQQVSKVQHQKFKEGDGKSEQSDFSIRRWKRPTFAISLRKETKRRSWLTMCKIIFLFISESTFRWCSLSVLIEILHGKPFKHNRS